MPAHGDFITGLNVIELVVLGQHDKQFVSLLGHGEQTGIRSVEQDGTHPDLKDILPSVLRGSIRMASGRRNRFT